MTNTIRAIRIGVGGLMAAGAVCALLATEASAEPGCVAGCNAQKRGCMGTTAKPGKSSCKSDCKATARGSEKGACMQGCADDFRAAKDTCKAQRATCKGVCGEADGDSNAGGVDGACVSECAHQLGDCARANAESGKACMDACKENKGPGFSDCVKACAGTHGPGAQACNDAFRACAQGCGASVPSTTVTLPPTTITSPPGTSTTVAVSTTAPGVSTSTTLQVPTTTTTAITIP